MRCCFLILAMMSFTIVALGAPKKGDQGPDAKTAPSLDGVWRGFVVDGKGERPDRGQTHLELTIQGDRITARRLDGGALPITQGIYRMLPGKISLMDATEMRDRAKGKVFQGICRLETDMLAWCVSTPGARRPRTFETRGSQFLLILNRQKQ